ncbi:hypothetical protein AB0K51_28000 [Kitasatospora sp. NPDC049285]|uniref:hypothetical protein n=1 Tax=Kitasatospora sp. NPDC049285 TaxID=3157096 RepID=UPI003438C9CD
METPAPTMVQYGESRVRALCEAAGLAARAPEIVDNYRLLSGSWGSRRIDRPPRWSYATADSTPLELSVVLEDRLTGLGVAVEAQASPATAPAYWRSASDLTERLGSRFGLSLERLRRVEDLFRVDGPLPRHQSMATYHAMGWSERGRPAVKLYFWAGSSGAGLLGPVGAEALDRLGLSAQRQRISAALHPEDTVSYLSLDLTETGAARTKLYVQHRGELTADRLERLGRLAADHAPGEAAALVRAAVGAAAASSWPPGTSARDRMQWLSNRRRHWPAGTYLSMTDGVPGAIESAVHQLALPPLCRSDAEAAALVERILTEFGVGAEAAAAYRRCRDALTRRPLAAERYAHTFVSAKRRADGRPRVVVYFNPRMFLARHGLSNGDLRQALRWAGADGAAGDVGTDGGVALPSSSAWSAAENALG